MYGTEFDKITIKLAQTHKSDQLKSNYTSVFENLNQNKVNELLFTLNDMTQPNKDDIYAIMSKI